MEPLNTFIEQTNLKPDLTGADIDALVSEAGKCKFKGICVPPFWVKRARREAGKDLLVVTVAGFPLGYQMTETKLEEINIALATGADEVDVVMNLSAFKSQMEWTKIELAKCARAMHKQEKVLKVIIETAYLSDEEIVKACRICADAGADYVKTSTGFAPSGASPAHIKLMRQSLPASVGIKASGGIRDLDLALELIAAGADRIGTSSGTRLMEEWLKKQKGT